jgi:hypothetical protein
MSIPTVAVTCIAYDQNGNPVIGGLFRARLDRTETYNGFVVPEQVTGTADANGVAVLQLWPNALGVAGSSYRITAINPDTRQQYLNTTAVVPNSACNLHEIIVAAPFPPIDASEQALIAAQGALALVTAQAGIAINAATQAEGHADNAQDSATSASASALTASNAAQTATTKAGEASTSATNASTSASTAATQATLAQGFANASEASAAAAASSASAANASAGIAITQAGIATNSATEAGNFASVATSAANTATTQAQTATAQAGIATEAAQAALAVANDPNVATVGQNIASVNAVANSISSVNTVASNTANVNTVAGISASVTTVAGNTANINTVAASNTNIDTVANNIGNVNIAGANIASVNLVSESIEDVNTVAAALAEPLSAANAVSYDNTGTVLKATNVQIGINELEGYAWTLADNRLRESFRKEKATTIAPSLLLDFQGDKRLDPRITFTRASSARYYDGQTVAKAEENLLLRSQEFDNAAWSKFNASVTANTEVAPDGTITAETLTDNATSGSHRVVQTFSIVNNATYAFSVHLKKGTSDFASLLLTDFVTSQRYITAEFNLVTGVVSRDANGTSGTLVSSSIVSLGNGWYRCVIVGSLSAGTTISATVAASDGTSSIGVFGSISYVGTGSTVFLWGAQLEQRASVTAYTPTTTQPITNYVPVLLSAANNVARFDHNPVTGESLGLLIEEQRTNLVTYSEEFDDAAWTKTRSSITANTIVAPDGTLTGDKLIGNTDNNTHRLDRSFSWASGTSYTYSIYVKQGEQARIRISYPAASFATTAFADFNLFTGAATPGAGATATILNVGNGWFRCSVNATATTAATASLLNVLLDNTGAATYTGDGYSGIYIWGAQLETGAFPTSYIPTVASQVTRSADAAVMTGANFSSWYNQAEGTLFAEASVSRPSTPTSIVSIDDGTTNNRININHTGTTASRLIVVSGGSLDVNMNTVVGTYPLNQFGKVAAALKANSFALVNNSSAVVEDTSGNMPIGANRLGIGFGAAGPTQATTYFKRIAFFPKRLANDQLQGITT